MTNEEAKEYVNSVFDEHFGDMWVSATNKFALAQDLAVSALEKQIPKKPYLEGDGYADGAMVYDIWRCPNCDRAYEVDNDDYDYCPNCGQKLDWGNEE